MDLCVGLLGFLLVVGLVVLVGHGGWLLISAIFSGITGYKPARPGTTHCPACGTRAMEGEYRCEICHLDQSSRLARYLRDTDAADHIIAHLQRDDYLDAATGGKVRRVLADRRQAMLSPGLQKPWTVVENLLAEERSTAELAPTQIRGLLFFFEQMTSGEWNRLRSNDLYRVGRLLEDRDAKWRALDLYEHVVTTQTISTVRLPAALRGASLSIALSDRSRGRRFLEHARRWAQTTDERQRIAVLERQLGAPAEVPDPEVVDINEAVPEAKIAESAAEVYTLAEPVAETPPPVPVRRVRHEHVERDAPPPPPRRVREKPQEPAKPRRSFGEMLAGFMEEKNILWGELAGGLLIVGCSIALVISLWQTLEKIPYFPFLILTAITAAIFAAGLYTLRHWKLESTSRSLLLIATLLTPLDFLVLAGLQKGEGGGLSLAIEVSALAALGWLTWKAGRILATPLLDAKAGRPDYSAAITMATASASILLTPRWLPIAEPVAWLFVLLSMLPALVHALGSGWIVQSLGARDTVDRPRAASLLLYLGETTFAVAMGLGFLVYWGGDPTRVFSHLAVPIAIVAWPMTLAATMLRRRLTDDEHSALVRVLSSACGFLGLALIALSLGLAWPRPAAIVIVGLANAAALAAIAWRWQRGWLLGLALPSFALAFVVGALAITGEIDWEREASDHLAKLLTGSMSSLTWMALAALWLGASEATARMGRGVATRFLWAGALLASLAGMGSIVRESLQMSGLAATVFASATAIGLVVAIRFRHAVIAWPAFTTLFATLFFAIRFASPGLHLDESLVVSLISYSWLVGIPGLIASKRFAEHHLLHAISLPMRTLALTASLIAIFPWATTLHWDSLWLSSGAMLMLSVWWGAWSRAEESPIGFALCQLGTGAAACIAAAAWMHGIGELQVWADLWHARSLQGILLALSIWALVWSIVRARLARRPEWIALFDPELPALDRVTLGVLLFVQFFVVASGVLPELAREIGVIPANLVGPHVDLMRGFIVVAILAGAMTWRMLGGRPMTGYLGLHFLAWTLPWLFAAPHRSDVASASALRWWLGLLFPIALSLTWARHSLLKNLRGWTQNADAEIKTTGRFAQWMALTLGLGILVFLTLATTERAFAELPMGGPIPGSLFARMGVMANMVGPLALLALGLLGTGVFEAKPGYLFAAILLTTATLVGGTALGMVQAQITIREAQLIRLAQVGLGTAAGCTILWLAIGKWRSRGYLTASITLARVISFPVLLATLFAAFVSSSFATALTDSTAWIVLGTVTLATIGVQRFVGRRSIVTVVCFDGLVAMLAAMGAVRFHRAAIEPWMLLVIELGVFSFVLLAISWAAQANRSQSDEPERFIDKLAALFPASASQWWIVGFAGSMFLTLLGLELAQFNSMQCAIGFALLTLLLGSVAVWRNSSLFVYISGLMPTAFVGLEWITDPWRKLGFFQAIEALDHEVWSWQLAVALAGASICWGFAIAQLRSLRKNTEEPRFRSVQFPLFAAGLATAALVVSEILATAFAAAGSGWSFAWQPALWMWGVVTAGILRSYFFGDEEERDAAPGMLYVMGLVWTAGLARWMGFDADSILHSLPWALAGFAVVAAFASRLLLKRVTKEENAFWFLAVQLFVLMASIVLGVRLTLLEKEAAARGSAQWPVLSAAAAAADGTCQSATRIAWLHRWHRSLLAAGSRRTAWAGMGADLPGMAASFRRHARGHACRGALSRQSRFGPHGSRVVEETRRLGWSPRWRG
ncbi:MAG: hypothetical protein U0744_00350 [Gemmataceae bacterium]